MEESLITCRDHPFQSFQMPTNEDSQNLKPLSTSKCHCCFRIVLGNNRVDTIVCGKLVNCDTNEMNVQKLCSALPYKSPVINEIENAAKHPHVYLVHIKLCCLELFSCNVFVIGFLWEQPSNERTITTQPVGTTLQ